MERSRKKGFNIRGSLFCMGKCLLKFGSNQQRGCNMRMSKQNKTEKNAS